MIHRSLLRALLVVSLVPVLGIRAYAALGDAGGSHRWGVVINGDTEERHRMNADLVYEFMQGYYHIPPDHIYFLSTRPGKGGIQGDGVGQNVMLAARQLAETLPADDELVVYTTGHGGREESVGGFIALADGIVKAGDFAHAFLANKAGKTVYFGDQCDSGSLAKSMIETDKRVMALSSVDDKHSTVCNFFIVPYLDAFKDPANDVDPKDGIVTEWEAFSSAKRQSLESHRRMIDEMRRHNQSSDETAEEMSSGMYLLSPAWSKDGRGAGK